MERATKVLRYMRAADRLTSLHLNYMAAMALGGIEEHPRWGKLGRERSAQVADRCNHIRHELLYRAKIVATGKIPEVRTVFMTSKGVSNVFKKDKSWYEKWCLSQ